MFLCPSTTPGIVSTSTSCSAARCFNAKLRICSCANRISSTTCCGNSRMHAAISLSERRKDAGDHLSNFSEYSRTAISPRAAISARIASTVLRTCALFSAFASADCPLLMWRIMACSPKLIAPVYDDLYGMHASARWGRMALEKTISIVFGFRARPRARG